jgi:gamma-glutamyltranspeptidase / glutathione hydrolase
MNALQASIAGVVHPIYSRCDAVRAIFSGSGREGRYVEGDKVRQSVMADALEALAIEGDGLFYRGEIARLIVRDCEQEGGLLTREDLERYRVYIREPLATDYRDALVMTNPPPASGGVLISFALELLAHTEPGAYSFGSVEHLRLITEALRLTQKARVDTLLASGYLDADRLLDTAYLGVYREQIEGRASALRGTTHVSVIDGAGNVASMSISNGEGCGAIVPGVGIMLNNMLGEDDLSPHGLHGWREDQRMTSMMAPSVVLRPDSVIAIGSGGSNRIRSAILQVLVNVIDLRMALEPAVYSPRVHLEGELLSLEGGFDLEALTPLLAAFPDHTAWPALNLFSGGTHTVMSAGRDFHCAGDPRRGGVCRESRI